MKREYYKQHSDVLNEDMSMIVYGDGGWPVIAFQAQDSKSNNFEDFGMIDVLAPFIDEGRIQVFSVDNLDEESWSDEGGDKGARAWRQEEYFRFVTDELVPRVHAWNNSDRRPIAVGCSMGATHAAIAALRRPDLFQGCIALSGVYSTSFFFGDYMDENLYNNDVPAFLTNMPADHPYVELYNQRQLVLCVGQGAWEMGIDDLRYIDDQLNRLGAKHWCDFWGYDVNHDWPWWRKQMPYFMNEVLGQIEGAEAEAAEKRAAAEAEAAKKAKAEAAKKAKAEAAKKAAAEKKAAKEAAAKKAAEEAAAKAAAEKAEAEAKAKAEAEAAAKKAEAEAKAKAEAEAAAKKAEEEAAAKAEAESAKKASATKKPAAKRTTTRKAAPKKTAATAKAAEPKTDEPVAATEAEAPATEAKPAAKKPAAKRTTTRKATTTKTTTAAKKPAAKRTTTRKVATPKADDAQ